MILKKEGYVKRRLESEEGNHIIIISKDKRNNEKCLNYKKTYQATKRSC